MLTTVVGTHVASDGADAWCRQAPLTDHQERDNDERVDEREPVNLGVEDVPGDAVGSARMVTSANAPSYAQIHVPPQRPRNLGFLLEPHPRASACAPTQQPTAGLTSHDTLYV